MTFSRWREFLRVRQDPDSAVGFLPSGAETKALRRSQWTWTAVAALFYLLEFAALWAVMSALLKLNMLAALAWSSVVVILWRLGIGTAANIIRQQARNQRLGTDLVRYADFHEEINEPFVLFLRSFVRESTHSSFLRDRFFLAWGEELESSVQIERTLCRLSRGSARLLSVGENRKSSWHGTTVVSLDEVQWETQVADLMDLASLVVIYIVRQIGDKGIERELELASSKMERAEKTIVIVPSRTAAQFEGDDTLRVSEVIGVPESPAPSWTQILVVIGVLGTMIAFGWLPAWLLLVLIAAWIVTPEAIYYTAIWSFAGALFEAARNKARFESDHRWPKAFVLRTVFSVAPWLLRQDLEYPDLG